MSHNNDTAYAFCLDAVKSNDVYFRTVSLFDGFAEYGRDTRKAYPVNIANFEKIITSLGNSFIWVNNDEDLQCWMKIKGWMLTPIKFAETNLRCLLKCSVCVKSPLGLFWDVKIKRNRATSRRTTKHRDQVLARDGNKCILCHAAESDSVKLTMDHIIPYSRGGETTVENLVTLCKQCNNGLGNNSHEYLFELAGLHHGWDPQEVATSHLTSDILANAVKLSQNILVSRCVKSFGSATNKRTEVL